LQELVVEINVAAARLAREVADRFTAADPARPRWVAGSIGPTNRHAVQLRPTFDGIPVPVRSTSDESTGAFRQTALALQRGRWSDLLPRRDRISTRLNAKAALKAILDLRDEGLARVADLDLGTITDLSGRTLSGQTVEAVLDLGASRRAVRRRPSTVRWGRG